MIDKQFKGRTPMATLTHTTDTSAQIPKDFRTVIVAASVGNVIEWYDFYIFGSLAAILSVKFFEQSHPVAALLSTIALFTAGFLIRPLGAFLFGWMGDRVDPDLRVDRSDRRVPPLRHADDPGPLPGRRVWRRHHLRRRACLGRTPRLLYRLAADLSDARDRGVAGRDHRDTHVFRHRSIRRVGVANSVPDLLPAGGHRNLHSAPTPGDADLPGDQGQGADDQESLERGLHHLQHQVRADRLHCADRAGSGLVQRSVLGVVFPAAGFQGGPADHGLHRGSRAAHLNAELDLFWLAVGHHRPQASDLGRD